MKANIPHKVEFTLNKLAEVAFEGCENIVICAPTDTYAYEYAIKNNLRVESV